MGDPNSPSHIHPHVHDPQIYQQQRPGLIQNSHDISTKNWDKPNNEVTFYQ